MTGSTESLRQRELDVAREIAHAFLSATTALEVYRLALARVTPMVRANFSSVFLREPTDKTLLKLSCAHNWPQASARFLGQLRVRVGRGPTGRAVAENQPCEVHDVFADAMLREWWDPARELGFVSLISLPLRGRDEAVGALTFYFDSPQTFNDDERHLLMLIADQVAVTSGRAEQTDSVRRELERLRADNQRLRELLGAGEEAKRSKDEFVSNISHELRTPLAAILGYAGLLTGGQEGPLTEDQRSVVHKIEGSAQVLLRLINDLLDLTQLKLGRIALNAAPDDATHIAERALEAAGAPPTAVQVALELPRERLQLLVDGEKVAKILENLLTNAYKFTPTGTVTLSVRAASDGGRRAVEWVVADTGIGIATDKHDAIFDEFRQVDGSSTRLYGGTGLGLALSRHLAETLGGRLSVQSELGQGARFRLVIPVAA